MTPERWQQVKAIFNSAINYRPEERNDFLSEACSNDYQLRSEVESLIRSHEKSGEFIDAPAYQEAADLLSGDNAELKPGQTIASYEIVSFISRGGMGEVYLAHDRRLTRKVALKILPGSFTKDPDRLRRFEQEARSASALNHPNIITIYEILRVDSTQVIATEFVEGETLRQRLAHSPLSLSEALPVAIQVADALAAAHKAGIIHRDIKPENIMLRPDGYVKVLDFGLAKLVDHSPTVVAAEAPTRQVRTGSGIVIGTAGYMSPEQARGQTVDERSDVFSLGAVIYEMVVSRKPFDGETPSDVLAAILKTEPPRISHLVPGTPVELVRIVSKSLRKDREERYQVIKDLLLDLKALKQELEFNQKLEESVVPNRVTGADIALGASTSLSTAVSTAGTAEIRSPVSSITESLSLEIRRHKSGALLLLGGLVLVLTLGAFGLYKLLNRSTGPSHFQNMRITRLTNSGKAIDATISPDGKYLVYVLSDAGKQSLWIRQVSTANDKEIVAAQPVGFFGIAFSRDGNDVYYCLKTNFDAGTLYRVPALGGPPVKILEKIDTPVSFSPDGKRFVFLRGNYPKEGESAVVTASVDGTDEQVLATKKPLEYLTPIFFTGPSWSPDGKLIATAVSSLGSSSRIATFGVEDRTEKTLTNQPWPFIARVEWLPDMSGLIFVAGDGPGASQIWFLSYPDGHVRRITNDLNAYRAIGLTTDATKMSSVQASGLVNVWVAPDGDAKRAVQLPTGNVGFFVSNGNSLFWTPDGRILFASNESGAMDIWVMDIDGKNRKQLTSKMGYNTSPVVSADGRFIVFSSTRGGARNIWRMNMDGGNAVKLTSGVVDVLPSVSPDGKWVVYTSVTGTKPTAWKVGIDGGTPSAMTTGVAVSPIFSPDGQYIAYFYPESVDPLSPPNRIAIIPSSGGVPIKTFTFQSSGTISQLPQWSHDGKAVLYTVSTNNVTNIWSQPFAGGQPKQITDFKDSLMTGFAYSRDGKQLACTRGILLRDAVLISEEK